MIGRKKIGVSVQGWLQNEDQRPKIQDPKSTICGLTFAE